MILWVGTFKNRGDPGKSVRGQRKETENDQMKDDIRRFIPELGLESCVNWRERNVIYGNEM